MTTPQKDKRGRHRKRTSKETRKWEKEHLIPERPEWMSPETYSKLAELREKV